MISQPLSTRGLGGKGLPAAAFLELYIYLFYERAK